MLTLSQMIERYQYKKFTWLDVVHPTVDDIKSVFKECKLPAELSGDLLEASPRTKVQTAAGTIKAVMHLPIVKRTDIKHAHEIKLIATKKHLVTFRFDDIEAIDRFANQFEMTSVLDKEKDANGFYFLLSMLSSLVEALDFKLDHLEKKLQYVEENIFDNNERDTLVDISSINRRLVSFNHTLEPQIILMEKIREFIHNNDKTHLSIMNRIDEHFEHAIHRALSLSKTVDVMQNTNIALISTRQNEVMKIFSIMAFITFPLTLFTSMFGMNTVATPILGHPYDFWVIVGIMTFISIGFFAFFKYKKWM